jgi:hypothetical protein
MRRLGLALVAVGLIDAALQLIFVGLHFGYTHDETVYLSQLDPHVPDATWSAWRAWGTAVLMAPVSLTSASLAVTRLWATLLTSAGLVAAFWPWLRVLRSVVVPLAALLFATTWVTIYFGNGVQPNIFIALGAVAAVGLFLRSTYGENADRRIRLLIALGCAIFVIALVRPSDALLVAAPLGLACLVVPSTRRWAVAIPIALGVALGWLPWIVEAYQDFGGPINRYHLSQAHDAVGGLHLNVHTASVYARVLDGPFYAGGQYLSPGPYSALWLTVIAISLVCIVLGLVAASRMQRLAPVGLATVVAAMFALLYVFLLGYAAVRFLLPIAALLSLPLAVGLVWLSRRQVFGSRTVALAAVVALLAADLGLQLVSVHKHVTHDRTARATFEATGRALHGLGVQGRCVVIGSLDPAPVAYWARCVDGGQTIGTEINGKLGQALVTDATRFVAQGWRVVLVTRTTEVPTYFANWTHPSALPGVNDPSVQAWLSPAARQRG